ncbi:MAG: winged helix-turn-helix domain-containing protein [Candidatus Micrarchaeia archaeon]
MKALESSVAWRILRFFLEEGREAHVQGLARQLKISPASASVICRKMLAESVLKKEMKGNGAYYSLNEENPFARCMRTALFAGKAFQALPSDARLEAIAIYATDSLSRRQANFLVVTNMRAEYCQRLLKRLEQSMRLRCDFKIVSPQRLRELAAEKNHFIDEVLENHVDLKGRLRDFL